MAAGRDLDRIHRALRRVTVPFPHLSGLVGAARITLDARVPTMGVFASGRLVVNPGFATRLNERELVFVLAHEMMHLALRTHDRARGAGRLEFNYAHDYIINDLLRAELGFATIPANGLDLPGAREKSAEAILLEMRREGHEMASRTRVFDGDAVSVRARFPGAGHGPPQRGATGDDEAGDVLGDDVERRMFPGDAEAQAADAARVRVLAAKAAALAEAIDALRGRRGVGRGRESRSIAALRGLYRTPWQLALSRWLESVAPAERTFTRVSRRANGRDDIVLPGRRRAGWLLNVVLDTSASMADEIPRALGAIADFCDAAGVDQVRLVQCDAAVTCDECLPPEALALHSVHGYGGSDLSPALDHLAGDPQARAVMVVTDGDVVYPGEAPPFDLLWLLPSSAPYPFTPRYGRVVKMA
jgi:predicted metal-dependent peptidase